MRCVSSHPELLWRDVSWLCSCVFCVVLLTYALPPAIPNCSPQWLLLSSKVTGLGFSLSACLLSHFPSFSSSFMSVFDFSSTSLLFHSNFSQLFFPNGPCPVSRFLQILFSFSFLSLTCSFCADHKPSSSAYSQWYTRLCAMDLLLFYSSSIMIFAADFLFRSQIFPLFFF